jgi:transposase
MPEEITPGSPEPEWAALVAIDWGDKNHCWELLVAGSQRPEGGQLEHTPEAVDDWATQLHHRFGGRPIAVCLEQSRGALVYQLSKYPHLVLYPVHPNTSAQFRRAFYPSGAKSDPADTGVLLELLRYHRDRLRRLDPDTPETRLLKILVEQRRQLVDDKTRVSNRMTAWLKIYFPQALEWIDDIDSALGCEFLQQWPTLEALQRTKPNVLRRFFIDHNCRSEERIQQRIQAIYQARSAISDRAMLEGGPAIVSALVREAQALAAGILDLERRIQQVLQTHPDKALFESFPGLGPALLPRAIVAFGTQRERFSDAEELQCCSGIAPVTEQSGRTKVVHFRYACPQFTRQTFMEWAAHSMGTSAWARAFYDLKRSEKMGHFAAIRELAYKWQRIAFACWKKGTPYDEQVYMASLRKHHSPLVTHVQWTTVAGFSKLAAKTT